MEPKALLLASFELLSVWQIFVDNVLLFLGIAPTFALYPQKMKAERLKFYFRPQPVDNSVDKSLFGYLVLGK